MFTASQLYNKPNVVKEHEDGYVVFHVEDTVFGYLLHCSVHQWNTTTHKRVEEVFRHICKRYLDRGVPYFLSVIPADDPKNKKFADMYGFQYYALLPESNNEVWVKRLDNAKRPIRKA